MDQDAPDTESWPEDPAQPAAPPKAKRSVGRRIWRGFRVLMRAGLAFALIFHIYAAALKILPVPTTITTVERTLEGKNIRRDWTRIEDVSPDLVYAIIGAEDSNFCTHNGVDWEATKDAFQSNQQGGQRRGASGLTQQTAKNVFFWNGGGYIRKAGEAWMAHYIDAAWGKRRVMEVYLNVAEWGDGIIGAEAAAQARFGKSASELTAREAALLAAVLPNPHKWRVDPPGQYVSGRANSLQSRAAVVRNEGFADCVFNADAKPKRPAPKPKATPKPEPEKQEHEAPTQNIEAEEEEISTEDLNAKAAEELKAQGDVDNAGTDVTETESAEPQSTELERLKSIQENRETAPAPKAETTTQPEVSEAAEPETDPAPDP